MIALERQYMVCVVFMSVCQGASSAFPWYLRHLGIAGVGEYNDRCGKPRANPLALPGLNRLLGSRVFFIVFINFTVPSPSSSTRYSFFPIPTPCSPVPVNLEVDRQSLEG